MADEKRPTFYEKINALMQDIGGYIQKDGNNTQQNYKYVSESAVLSKVQPALVTHRLSVCPRFELIKCEDKATAKGTIWQLATVQCEITLFDVDNAADSITFTGLGQGTDPGDKAVAKAQTQAYKYAWWKFLCLETGDDPEADTRTDNVGFAVPGSIPAVPAAVNPISSLIVDTRSSTPMQELVNIWNYAGWNVGDVEGYVLKRFGKEQIAYVTPAEFSALITEMAAYLTSIGKPVEEVPFK